MKYYIDSKSDEANYIQLMKQIKEAIFNGTLNESNQLPSIRSLAKELNIAIITVKRAYDELEGEGFIENIQGKGCFVKKNEVEKLVNQREDEITKRLKSIVLDAQNYGIDEKEMNILIKKIWEDIKNG